MAFSANAVPVSRWHQVQWQQWTIKKGASTSYVMVLQVQWPFRGVKGSLAILEDLNGLQGVVKMSRELSHTHQNVDLEFGGRSFTVKICHGHVTMLLPSQPQ